MYETLEQMRRERDRAIEIVRMWHNPPVLGDESGHESGHDGEGEGGCETCLFLRSVNARLRQEAVERGQFEETTSRPGDWRGEVEG